MKTLDKKTQMIVVVIAVTAVIFFFGIFPMLQTFLTQGPSEATQNIPPPPGVFDGAVPPPPPDVVPGDAQVSDTSVSVSHTFLDGKHTVSGTIMTPTPCHALAHNTTIAESYPEQVTMHFVISEPEGGVMCAQVIDEKEFTVTFTASENASIQATLNGSPVTLSFE